MDLIIYFLIIHYEEEQKKNELHKKSVSFIFVEKLEVSCLSDFGWFLVVVAVLEAFIGFGGAGFRVLVVWFLISRIRVVIVIRWVVEGGLLVLGGGGELRLVVLQGILAVVIGGCLRVARIYPGFFGQRLDSRGPLLDLVL